jgi:hypothetical protein
MCTNITIRTDVEGSAKGAQGWFRVDTAHVSFDHPFHAPFDHTLNIDLVNERDATTPRVAMELSPATARTLAANIMRALEEGAAEAGVELEPAMAAEGTD